MTAQKIIEKIDSFLGNISGNTSQEISLKLSAINSSLSYLIGEYDFENSIKSYTIDFDSEQIVYKLPDDFVALISLNYELSQDAYVDANRKKGWLYVSPEKIVKFGKVPSDAVLYALDGKKLYILTDNVFSKKTIDGCESLDGWSVLNDADNLDLTTIYRKKGKSAIKFDINVSKSPLNRATLKKTFTTSLNLKNYEGVSSFTFWIYIQRTTNLSSISFNWGTDSANYYKVSVSQQADGTPFVIGWNFLRFNWKDAIIIGSPSPSSIGFVSIDIDYSSSFTSSSNWYLDEIRVLIYDPIVVNYYSNLVVKSSTNVLKSSVDSTTDDVLIINDELSLSVIATLAILNYKGVSALDKTRFNDLYLFYSRKLKELYPPKKIIKKWGKLYSPTLR
jgi:hypothetical protein